MKTLVSMYTWHKRHSVVSKHVLMGININHPLGIDCAINHLFRDCAIYILSTH